jgi:pimeloyl-ACP methyl ester carboxylesterase
MTHCTHDTAPTQYAEAGTRFAYRPFWSPGRPPLVFFQHFMGTLDDHDPALRDAFVSDREVVLFNNAGVASSGTVPDTIEATARSSVTKMTAQCHAEPGDLCPAVRAVRQRCIRGIAVTRVVWQGTG